MQSRRQRGASASEESKRRRFFYLKKSPNASTALAGQDRLHRPAVVAAQRPAAGGRQAGVEVGRLRRGRDLSFCRTPLSL